MKNVKSQPVPVENGEVDSPVPEERSTEGRKEEESSASENGEKKSEEEAAENEEASNENNEVGTMKMNE